MRRFLKSVVIGAVLVFTLGAQGADLTATFLDVGQGDSIVLQCGRKAALVDAGRNGDQVVKQLRELGITRFEYVISTHPHVDHIGGIDEVLDAFPFSTYLDNGHFDDGRAYVDIERELDDHSIRRQVARAGKRLRLCPGVTLTILAPATDKVIDGAISPENAHSVVVLVRNRSRTLLLLGDAEAVVEEALVVGGDLPDDGVDVLKVSHHGSGYSSIPTFLEVVSPEIAVISVGRGNSYGHPQPGVLGRLEEVGAKVLRTDLDGTITIWTDGRKLLRLNAESQQGRPMLPQ